MMEMNGSAGYNAAGAGNEFMRQARGRNCFSLGKTEFDIKAEDNYDLTHLTRALCSLNMRQVPNLC